MAAENRSLETPDKANAFFIAGQNLKLRDDDPDYPALVLGNYMLGGGFLNSRLAVRIRQKDGLSYGVGSQLQASPLDPSGSFTTFAIYAPQNEAKLEAAFKEEIARMLKDGFEAKEITEAKSGWLQSRQVGARAGSGARANARDRPLHSPDARLGRRLREEGGVAHRRPDRRRDAQVPRPFEDDDREGGRLREVRRKRCGARRRPEELTP